jgi:UDP-N-acetylglucosamine 2-epimerase (non-hydrolysing)
MKVSMVLGIRPDIIRASKIVAMLRERYKQDFELIWTGQHYSTNLKDVFFEELGVEMPEVELNVKGDSDAEISGNGIKALYVHLQKSRPNVVIFLGDTNTVLTAIAAAQLNIPILHIEGCMRSYDWRMPEEKYRTVVDHLADRIFAYTDLYKANGVLEGLEPNRILVTGNPIVEVLQEFLESDSYNENLNYSLHSRNLKTQEFYLATCHRRENVESEFALNNIFRLLAGLDLPVILPLSYRTKRQLEQYQIIPPDNVKIEEPLSYTEFVTLLNNSKGVLTDSGTVIEEACILGVPSLQLRKSTERPEVYEVKSSIKFDPTLENNIPELMGQFNKLSMENWKHPFGDGRASERIYQGIVEFEQGYHELSRKPDFSKRSVKLAYRNHE